MGNAWDECITIVAALFVVAGILFFACIGSCEGGRQKMRYQAVEAGVAEWYLDDDANKQFRWKPCDVENDNTKGTP